MILRKEQLKLAYEVLAKARTDYEKDYLTLADARFRDSVATKAILPLLNEYENALMAIYRDLCVKKEDGTPDMLAGNMFQFEPGKPSTDMVREKDILNAEVVDVAVDDPVKLKCLIENTKYEPAVGEAILIDGIISAI